MSFQMLQSIAQFRSLLLGTLFAYFRKLIIDCKTVGFFFLKISKEISKAWREAREAFSLTAHSYLNTQKYGLFCSLNR